MPDDGLEIKMSRIDMIRYQEYRRQRDVIQDGGPPESDFVDSQLAKAIAHLDTELTPKKDVKKGEKKDEKKKKDTPKKKKADAKKSDKKSPAKKKNKKPAEKKNTDKPKKKQPKNESEQSLRPRLPTAAPARIRGLPLFRLPDPVG